MTHTEQYIRKLLEKFKCRIIYTHDDKVIDNRLGKVSMLEDFWLPRKFEIETYEEARERLVHHNED